jgi:Zn-dependent protease with chaperone function
MSGSERGRDVGAIRAVYFDGRVALPRAVELSIERGRVRVRGDGVDRDVAVRAVDVPPPLGRTPRTLRFAGGAFCEVADHDAFNRLAAEARLKTDTVDRWERNWRWVLAACIGFALSVIALYVYGVPAAAGIIADRLPSGTIGVFSRQVLDVLDRTIFDPSAIPPGRQAALRAGMATLRLRGYEAGQEYVLQFRKSTVLGANAIALPDGTIVMTDALVALARDDRELLSVIAHEAGNVARRHGLRMFLQSSMVGLLVTWYVGDVSSLAAGAPAALIEANYSRGFEREADAYAAGLLIDAGIPLHFFGDMLERIEAQHPAGNRAGRDYISSHPSTAERVRRLRSK